jgi:hypothetical protein
MRLGRQVRRSSGKEARSLEAQPLADTAALTLAAQPTLLTWRHRQQAGGKPVGAPHHGLASHAPQHHLTPLCSQPASKRTVCGCEDRRR